MSNLQTHYHFTLDFQKADRHTGGEWLIHGTKHRKNNQLQSLKLPVEYLSRESKHDIKHSDGYMFNPTTAGNVQGREPPERCSFAEPELLSYRKPKSVDLNKKDWPLESQW